MRFRDESGHKGIRTKKKIFVYVVIIIIGGGSKKKSKTQPRQK